MKTLPNVASLVFNQPLLITPQYAETITAVLADRIGYSAEGLQINSGPAAKRSEKLLGRGTKVIPVVGSMSHRATGIEAMSGMQSYGAIQNSLQEALEDDTVKSILLDFDSPGGQVAGAFDLRDFIMENRGKKPMYALARDNMYSAAYLLGSATDKVFTTQTGGVGSIGVVMMHLDQSEKNTKEGVKPTFIYAGDYKVSGNPHQALDEATLKELQESVNDSYDMFVNAVAESRGIDEKLVRSTQARTYRGGKGIKAGLADGVRSYEALISDLSQHAPKIYQSAKAVGNTQKIEGNNMDNEQMTEVATQLEQAQTKLAELSADNEKLTSFLASEGYTLTENGYAKEAVKEMIEVEGTLVDKAILPDVVVKALEEKKAAEMNTAAANMFPNLNGDVALKLYTAFADDEKMVKTLSSLNSAVGGMMEEQGDTKVKDHLTAKEKLDKLVETKMATEGMDKFQATAAVSRTKEGRTLIQESYTNK